MNQSKLMLSMILAFLVYSGSLFSASSVIPLGPRHLRAFSDASSESFDSSRDDRAGDFGDCECVPFGSPGSGAWCRSLSGGACSMGDGGVDEEAEVMANCISLEVLDGPIPREISGQGLESLFLRFNKITGGWEHLPSSLRSLGIEGGCSMLPRSLLRLVHLKRLELSFVGRLGIRGGWSNIPLSVEWLDLEFGDMPEIPIEFAELANLKLLRLSNLHLTNIRSLDWIPRSLRTLIFKNCSTSNLGEGLVIPECLQEECKRRSIRIAVFNSGSSLLSLLETGKCSAASRLSFGKPVALGK